MSMTRNELLASLAAQFGEPIDPPAKKTGSIEHVLTLIAIPTIAQLVIGDPVPPKELEQLIADADFKHSIGFAIGLGAKGKGANLWRSANGDIAVRQSNIQKLLKYVSDIEALFVACGVADAAEFQAAVAKLPA